MTVLPGPWQTTTFSTTVLISFFAKSLCMAHRCFYTICMFTAPPPPVFVLHAHSTVFYNWLSFFQPRVFGLMHTGKPKGVAVSHCITSFQTQLSLTTFQIRYHSHLWDHL